MAQIQKQTPATTVPDEQILVVKRSILLGTQAWYGLKQEGVATFLETVKAQAEFMPRAAMEADPSYKQIIPYLVFSHNNKYFLMQRKSNASEQRLKNKMSFGIGGHIREEDLAGSIFDWARREFDEEVSYAGNGTLSVIGLINDDTTAVGQVHIGVALLLEGDSPQIAVKSELKSGELMTLTECARHYEHMETWSQFIFDYLKSR